MNVCDKCLPPLQRLEIASILKGMLPGVTASKYVCGVLPFSLQNLTLMISKNNLQICSSVNRLKLKHIYISTLKNLQRHRLCSSKSS